MTEKIYEIPVDSPLTPERRETISRFLDDNAHHFPVPVSHEWEEGVKPVLRLITQPVVWEAHFHTQSVEVFGNGPKWAALLFTKKKRLQLKERIEAVLAHAGFRIDSPAVS
jgi:hypothetical protein